MFTKRFPLVLAVLLLITFEITARDLASNHESEVEIFGGFTNRVRILYLTAPAYKAPQGSSPYNPPPTGCYCVGCCANKAGASANKQAQEAQTRNK
ncbi:hypothetical protein HanRHA438_Chr01g0004191 [Helianthus annuus]|nr:hypothetical protein HanRHA438_Chr01g0004191 [Helianthus annuus]KAJ0955511.1 hypothetical protein HanPSC8_Chr01g0003721 [Helianthus annuus]